MVIEKYEGKGETMQLEDPELDDIIRRNKERTGMTAMMAETSVESLGSASDDLVDQSMVLPSMHGRGGTLGIIWQSATRQMVHATTADTGYRTVLCVQSIVSGGPAAESGRVKQGDKLVSITEHNRLKSNLVGVRWSEIKKLLGGAVGSIATVELLRATELGAKKTFTVRLTRMARTEDMHVERTKVVRKSKGAVGARKGLLFKGLHTDESADEDAWAAEESHGDDGRGGRELHDSADPLNGLELDDEVERINRRLGRLSKLRVGHVLTADEILEVRGLEADLKMLIARIMRYKRASEHARSDLAKMKEAMNEAFAALVKLCSFAGQPLQNECACTHHRYKHTHNAMLAKEAAEQAVRAVIAEFEEIREIQLHLKRGGTSLQDLVKNTVEVQQRLDTMIAERDDIKENLDQKVEDFRKDTERMGKEAKEERDAIKKEGEDNIKAIHAEMDAKDEEIKKLKEKMHRVEEDMEAAKAAEDSAYAESLMLKSSMDMLTDQQQVELQAAENRAKMLVASALEANQSQQSIADRAQELRLREEIESLGKREEEMKEKLVALEERRKAQDVETARVEKFKRVVMVALCKVEPEQVDVEVARQQEGLVESVELLSVMHDYIEGQGSEYEEVWLCDVMDYITARFPFLCLDPWRLELCQGFDEAFGVATAEEEAMLAKIEKGTSKKGIFRGWPQRRDDYKGRPLTLDQMKAIEAKKRIAELRAVRDAREEEDSGSEGGGSARNVQVESDDDEL